jgi:hypothetical protein
MSGEPMLDLLAEKRFEKCSNCSRSIAIERGDPERRRVEGRNHAASELELKSSDLQSI